MIAVTESFLTSTRNRPFLRNPSHYEIPELKGIIIHWTANTSTGANARANRNYFNTTDRFASAHYMVDDKSILQCLPDNEVGFHVGASRYKPIGESVMEGGKGPNYFLVGIEMCVNKDGVWEKTYQNTVELTQMLLNRYNFTIFQVWRHYDITGKDCPKMMIDEEPWQKFRKDVNAGVKLPISEPVKKGRIMVEDYLNVREGIGSDSKIVGKLNPGDEVQIYDRIGKWYRVGDNRWVHGDYVEVILKSKSAVVVVDGDNLNIRKGPGTNFEIVDKFSSGTPVEVIDSSGNWLRIRDDSQGSPRWAYGSYIQFNQVRNGFVLSDRLIVREGPATSFPKVKRLTQGDVVRILKEEDQWLNIGKDEWVHGAYVQIVT